MNPVDPTKKVTVGIVGYGSFGKFLERRFLDEGHDVIVADKTREITGMSARHVVRHSNVVVFCVPLNEAPAIMERYKKYARKNQLWVDISGLKAGVTKAMEGCVCEYITIHPMCKPMDLKGQTIIVCDVKSERWTKWLLAFLRKQRGVIRKFTPEEHDEMMAIVQGLIHAVLLTVSVVLYGKGVDIPKTLTATSPVYKIIMDLVGRFIYEKPEMYIDMQILNKENIAPYLDQMSVAFADFKQLVAAGEHGRDALIKLLGRTREHFGDEIVEQMYEDTKDMIATLTNFSEGNAVRILTPPDEKGQLRNMLEPFENNNVNLLALNTQKRIDPETQERRTLFIVALENTVTSKKVQKTLEEVKALGFTIVES